MTKFFIFIVAIVIAVGAVFFFKDQTQPPEVQQTNSENPAFNFRNPKKSAHYESNTPAHGAILAAAPVNIVLDFNFDLAKPSSIFITKDGKEYGVGETTIDSKQLSMRRNFDQNAPDGLYKVSYNACWPDRSCHDGYFEFAIDRSKAGFFENQQVKQEVIIRLSELSFKPKDVIVSQATKITWINDEDTEHYINTDSHPYHSYHPSQNSKALKKGESFSLTLADPGVYPYHCSAHANVMTGNIIVQ